MKKELKYVTIEYSDKDLSYIDELSAHISSSCEEIISFLNIQDFGAKTDVKLWDNLDDFRDFFKLNFTMRDKSGEVNKWICGFANNNAVHTLTFEEYIKTMGHENNTLLDLKYLVMHEFTHVCHAKISDNLDYAWFNEGLATTITHQYENSSRTFDFTLEQVINGGSDYGNYYTMFAYVYETYGKEYILSLINNYDLLKEVTPKLYEETKNIYGDSYIK